MHEQAIARKIIEEAELHGSVKSIRVECGELAHLPASDLSKMLRNMAQFEVEVDEKPAIVACGKCGFKGSPSIEMKGHDFSVFFCRKCGAVPEIIDGKEIVLKTVDVE
ncbi:MAG: hydrogenase/urease maturation nickel metallochaperone HypA [Nanoarchaeota archaeon]